MPVMYKNSKVIRFVGKICMNEANLNRAELLNINKIKYFVKSANQLGAMHDIRFNHCTCNN